MLKHNAQTQHSRHNERESRGRHELGQRRCASSIAHRKSPRASVTTPMDEKEALGEFFYEKGDGERRLAT